MSGLSCLWSLNMPQPASPTRTFIVDTSHSEVTFQVRHLLTKVRGRFSNFSGTVELDEARPDRSKVSFVVQAGSVDTGQDDRDTHLKSADFFAVDTFPTLTFASSRIIDRGNGQFDVAGELTIRGVTQAMVLPVSFLGRAKDPWGTEKLAFETAVTIDREEFGLVWNAPLEAGGFLVGDQVTVSISLQMRPA
jgi:polyisoprenoid-binding protein YceI